MLIASPSDNFCVAEGVQSLSVAASHLTTTLMETVDRVYVKRTRRGQVKTFVRQQYLRDDLPTGSPHLDGPEHGEPRLSAGAKRYLVLDTNVVLHQIDLLERPALCDVVILQTVLEEVRHNKISVHKRLRALIADERRRFHVFSNEFHRETYVARQPGESPNDRNDRAIRRAAEWYQAQLGDAVEVLLLTNDADNKQKALKAGLHAQSIHAHVRSLPNADELQDLLVNTGGGGGPEGGEDEGGGSGGGGGGGGGGRGRVKKGGSRYPAHLPMSELTRGIASGELYQGKLHVNRHNPQQGYVSVKGLPAGHSDVLLRDRTAMNRGVEGDTVVVRLLPQAEWKRAAAGSERLADQSSKEAEAEDDELAVAGAREAEAAVEVFAAEFGANEEAQKFQAAPPAAAAGAGTAGAGAGAGAGAAGAAGAGAAGGGGRACGCVVGVVKRNWRPYVCVLDPESAIGSQYLVEPLDTRIPKVNITTRQPEILAGKLLLVSIDFWEAAHRFPTGHYVRSLGAVGDTAAESEAILHEHEVNSSPFSAQVQACLPEKGWTIPDDEVARRLDLRNGRALVCSVDPPGCVDIDDALHARETAPGSGVYEVGVHIADVGHFIKAGTPIDDEAAARGTTVYLVNRRIDMVPKRLGEDLCSLHQHVDRLAFSVIWTMDADANVTKTTFHKTVIKSEGALSYAEAQLRMDDPKMDDALTASLRTLNALAKKLKAARSASGALTLASPEVRFTLDSETSDPTDVGVYEHKEANSMVEEFMLLANISVAREITRAFPQFAMLRRHPAPTPGAFSGLQKQLAQHGLELDDSSSLALTASLDRCVKPGDAYFNKLARILCTRCMQQARYFCSGSLTPSDYHHYGLAAPIYTHFTSPIRRYSDQVVHRLLAALIRWEAVSADTLDARAMGDLVDNLNLRHTMAQHAGRASVGLHTLIFFKGRSSTPKGEQLEDAYIIKVRENGVVVLVPRYGIEGIVYVSEPGAPSPFAFDAAEEALRAPGCVLRTFDKVRVRISVDQSKAHRPKLKLSITEPVLPTLRAAGA